MHSSISNSIAALEPLRTNALPKGLAKLKALYPVISTNAPSVATVLRYDDHRATLQSGRYLGAGTLVQLHVSGDFSLWIVRRCSPSGDLFDLELELAEVVSVR